MTTSPPRYARILVGTALAAAGSAAVNAAVRFAAVATLDIPQPQYEPLDLGAVVTSSVIGAVAGGAVFAVLARFTARPARVFLPVVAAALALSMIPVLGVNLAEPARYPGAGAAAGFTLAFMHLVVTAALLGGLWWAQRTGRRTDTETTGPR